MSSKAPYDSESATLRGPARWVNFLLAMDPQKQAKTFFYQGNPVGYFEEEHLPAALGNYRYMPYRGPGHYRLMGALKSEGPQRCHFEKEGRKLFFTVKAWISTGLLELSEFDSSSPEAS